MAFDMREEGTETEVRYKAHTQASKQKEKKFMPHVLVHRSYGMSLQCAN